ncbi:MAG: deoxyguanosinetriphosphate triphosphohydrolase [Candidatus Puniceispirillaceae bacterium]
MFYDETASLSSFASMARHSRGRLIKEEEGSSTRSDFQRDRDRIIHSAAFRRLKHKTQVFIYHEGDYFRTRLTHSLEVAQIARSCARALGVNEDLAEAIALAHDLGHTPFGHAGEDALNEVMTPYGGFDHNEQTIRVLTQLEERYASFDGLNLTWETLEGIAKHNGPVTGTIRPTIKTLDQAFDLQLPHFASIEAQLANLSDDIAYLSHDFDDGLRAGLLQLDALKDLPVVGQILTDIQAQWPDLAINRLSHELTRRLISHFVEDLLAKSQDLLRHHAPQSADDVRTLSAPVICFSAQADGDLKMLKAYLFTHVYRHYKVNRMTSKARRAVKRLFTLFMEEPNLLPHDWQDKLPQDEAMRARIVCDYVASMTDRYALLEYERIFEMGPILS